MPQRKIRASMMIGVGLSVAALSGVRADACDYHWALGVPEPTRVWPTPSSAAVAQPSLSSATNSAINALTLQDTINDAAITKWMQNTTGKKGHSTNATIN